MSVRLTANQNKIRLIAVFLFTLIIVGILRIYQGQLHPGERANASKAEALDDSLFVGMRHVSAPDVQQVLPETVGKPSVIYFGSRLCHDCQRMAPVVAQVMPQYPNVYFKKFDVFEDKSKSPAVLHTFRPVSVPILVFINPQGEIRNVLYDYNKPEVVTSALNSLQHEAAPKKADLKSQAVAPDKPSDKKSR
jgi:thiol:disulfide interchange protein